MNYITKLTPEMSGKKVSCRIRNKDIKEALLVFYKNNYYMLQDIESGAIFRGYKKYGYKHCYVVDRDPLNYNIKLLSKKSYELWEK